MAAQTSQLGPAFGVPHADRLVSRPAGYLSAVGRKRDALHQVSMAAQAAQLGPAFGVPHADRPVARPADNLSAIGRKRDAKHNTLVAAQTAQLGPAFGVPHADRLVQRPADDPPAVVGRKRDAVHTALVAAQHGQLGRSKVNRWGTEGPDPGESGCRRAFFIAPKHEQLVQLGSRLRPGGRSRPATLRLDIMSGRLRAVVPPARVPQTLKEPLRVVFRVTSDEMDVPADRLLQQTQDAALGIGCGQLVDDLAEIVGEVEHQPDPGLGLQERQIGQQMLQVIEAFGAEQVRRQMAEPERGHGRNAALVGRPTGVSQPLVTLAATDVIFTSSILFGGQPIGKGFMKNGVPSPTFLVPADGQVRGECAQDLR